VAVPTPIPVTEPVADTVATLTGRHDHAPPEAELESEILLPMHTVEGPVIVPGTGSGLIVIVLVAFTVPQTLVTE